MAHIAGHFGWLAEQYIQWHIHRIIAEMTIMHFQFLNLGGVTQHRIRAAFPLAQCLEGVQLVCGNRQCITLLGLIAPDFHGGHARLVDMHFAQFEFRTTATVVYQLRQRIGNTAGAHIVNPDNRVIVLTFLAHRPAAIDHFLTAPLHFRVTPLHRGKIQVFRTLAGRHGRRRTAAQANQHGRTTQQHNRCARRHMNFFDMLHAHIAVATGQHNRLVIAANLVAINPRAYFLKGAEVTINIGSTEFVIKGRRAQRTVEHNLQRRDNPLRLAKIAFPGLFKAGNAQIGHGKTAQPRLGLGAASGGTLIANFTARAGGRAGKR